MKCVILAGGSGDRLWPLSRRNFPKQFLNLDEGNSLFQETVTRNIPYCDGFYIVTNHAYQEIVEGQMKQFQGVPYKIILEKEARGTAIALETVSNMLSNEELLITPADLFIHGEGYADAIYKAKDIASQKKLVIFGIRAEAPSTIFGYIQYRGNEVVRFIEKPTQVLADKIFANDDILWNSGLLLCNNVQLKDEFKRYVPKLKEHVDRIHIEKAILEHSENLAVVPLRCKWSDISNFDTYQNLMQLQQDRNSICASCENTTVINTSERQLVVANRLKDTYIINTRDAIYITDKEYEQDIKSIMLNKPDKYSDFFDYTSIVYRPWGTREVISQDKGYRVRRLIVYAGESLSLHSHVKRTENYSTVDGVLSVELNDGIQHVKAGESINILPNQLHRLFNNTDKDVVAIEVDIGEEINEQDMVNIEDVNELEIPNLYYLSPTYKDYIWGGKQLVDLFHKNSPYENTAEAWELSAHPDGQSYITGGLLDGMPFGDFVEEYGAKVCGWKSNTFDKFPILIKFIDATNSLSVQVHPFDDFAFVNEKEFGKNEMWYVMDAKPDAFLYIGFKNNVSKEEVLKHIENNTITELLNKVEVKKGDVLFIPAGTIHAIGDGILICEIQQNSNSTYRVYDYERKDDAGNYRDLHIKKAMEVITTDAYHKNAYGYEKPIVDGTTTIQKLCLCKYFECTKYSLIESTVLYLDDSSFASIILLSGKAKFSCKDEVLEVKAGDSIFVSAGRKVVHVEGECEFILTNI